MHRSSSAVTFRLALFVHTALLASSAAALEKFPAWVTVPSGVKHLNDGNMEVVDVGEATFPTGAEKSETVRGKKYFNYVTVPESVAGDWSNGAAIYAWMKKALVAGGWKEVYSDGASGTFRLQKPAEAWLRVEIHDETTTTLAVIEVAGAATALALAPPAESPEKIAEGTDFPYLARYPGSRFNREDRYDVPLTVVGPDGQEPLAVGRGYVEKDYATPERLSAMQFIEVYDAALRKAGWTIAGQDKTSVTAHFAKSGRDLWARLMWTADDLRFAVADAGASLAAGPMKAALDRDCHVPIYGITFDFDKATLKPDATPVLEKVLALLKQYGDLKVELQGHTDNVGKRDYNQRLSEARVVTVKTWLSGKGIAVSRLAAKGYADTVPVAPNDTAEGRARNRRVELAKEGCQKH